MTIDCTALSTGPAAFKLNSTEVGSTEGNIQANIQPAQKIRNVDVWGSSAVCVYHQGDDVRLTVPWSEWSAAVIAEVYAAGNDQTGSGSGSNANYMGLGRKAGYLYTTKAAMIVPRSATHAAKRLEFWKVTPVGQIQLQWGQDTDQIFSVEFLCLVDDTQDDGEAIGKIQVQ